MNYGITKCNFIKRTGIK